MAEEETQERPSRPRRRRGRPRQRRGGKRSDSAPLHQRSTSHFQPGDRKRGESYQKQGRVLLEVIGDRALAQVKGSNKSTYGVGIDWSRVAEERRLHVFCECERFAGGTPCKHIWATLLDLGGLGSRNANGAALPESDEGMGGPEGRRGQSRDKKGKKANGAATAVIAQPPGKSRIGLRKDRVSRWPELAAVSTHTKSTRSRKRRSRKSDDRRQRPAGGPSWRRQLLSISEDTEKLLDAQAQAQTAAKNGQANVLQSDVSIYLLLNTTASAAGGQLTLDIFGRKPTQSGKPGKLRRQDLELAEIEELLSGGESGNSADETAMTVVAAVSPDAPKGGKGNQRRARGNRKKKRAAARSGGFPRIQLPPSLWDSVLPDLAQRDALRLWDGRRLGDPKTLRYATGDPWTLALHLEFAAAGRMRLRGILEREEQEVPLSKVQLLLPEPSDDGPGATLADSGRALVVVGDEIGHFEVKSAGDGPWIDLLTGKDEIVFPEGDMEEAVTTLLEMPGLPRLEAPEDFQLAREEAVVQPRLVLEPEDAPEFMNPQLLADLSFAYGVLEVSAGDARPAVIDFEKKRFIRREMEAEREYLVQLLELGLKPSAHPDVLELPPEELATVAEPLLAAGWEVEVRGTSYRSASPPKLRVESGLDWFELSGEVDFAGDRVEFARILEAISRGERTITLEDGSEGLLTSDMVDAYDSLAQLAQSSSEDGLRFHPSQAGLVDALLVAQPAVDVDSAFAALREKIRSFEAIDPQKAPRGFKGKLRGYQEMGLGWLEFLREYSLGGVLADDMGLGKTVQALALIKKYRTKSRTTGLPILVVAPRSLIYNWIDEAKRFTPTLETVEYLGAAREGLRDRLADFDLVVTTYGTLRRDIGHLATVEFDTVILDEAQAIKNPESQTAKAARLLQAEHRLALTGTPIENHLGELGSIFEFLNPGLLGRMPALEVLLGGRDASQKELELVARGLRPFILRRTKQEVLPDLPEKTEQVLLCTMTDEQQKLYDQLRVTYAESLLDQVEKKGVGGSTMQVLEALLRLRQIACHPGLVDESWSEAGSAKLETLLEQVKEILSEGHKVLVFSQFTKLLGFVRENLDEREITYAYLDGSTRDRAAVVDRFQNDPDTNLFLISLKAGGVGLNLTAASYVFLLDPWWNPAVEAQAIDRAHRIGQTQPVFAYKLIARDTVEEKMLELQGTKKQLAEAILEGKGTGLKDLSADDLRMLLS